MTGWKEAFESLLAAGVPRNVAKDLLFAMAYGRGEAGVASRVKP